MAEYIEREALKKILEYYRSAPHVHIAGSGISTGLEMGISGCISLLNNAPAADVVSKAAIEQLKWERDTAIEQLKEYGVSFCEKKKDMVEVVRCKDCKHWDFGDCYRQELTGPTDFCSYGELQDGE